MSAGKKKSEILLSNTFKDPANIKTSLNKLWAEVINIITNKDGYNSFTKAPSSQGEFEVSRE